jgi:hypothetical protein
MILRVDREASEIGVTDVLDALSGTGRAEHTVKVVGSVLNFSTRRRIARMSGGDARVSSEPAAGSTSTVTLNDAPPAGAEAPAGAASGAVAGGLAGGLAGSSPGPL